MMIKKSVLFTVVLMLIGMFIGSGPSFSQTEENKVTPEAENNLNSLVEGNNIFALELYHKLIEEPDLKENDGNLFFSPYSISSALAMTWAGARGDTETQMAETLHFTLGQDKLHGTLGRLQKWLNAQGRDSGYQLSVANALWGQEGHSFLPEFLDLNNKYYGAGLNLVDFKNETAREQARQTINTWIEEKTNHKIKDMIQPGILDELTRLVLTNAIYFKGDWASQFKEEDTKPAPFHITRQDQTQVDLMYQKGDFKYAEDDYKQILELPYKGEELSMFVILPKEIEGLNTIDKFLTPRILDEWTRKMYPREIRLYLPKFKMTSEFTLNQVLKEMGMPNAFSNKADFSGMDGTQGLYITAVLHKAFVEVNEEGTEAAAATAVVMGLKAMPARPPVFRADHPFIYLIRDNQTGSILFLGRMMNPSNFLPG